MSAELQSKAAKLFADRFGTVPDAVNFAPGRVNMIGEHVDYNDGLVLPMPVREGTAVGWSRVGGDGFEVVAADFGEDDSFSGEPDKPGEVSWRSYVRGMIAESELGSGGMRMLITGDLSRGSGLSSSASLCIAIGRALAQAGGVEIAPVDLARAAQRTEHNWAGVACGIMDQMAVAAGEPGHAMLLDCRDLTYSHRAVPEGWAVLITDSGVTRGLVDGEYNIRRAQCEAAAAALGVASLRDASLEQVAAAGLDEVTRRRALHVIAEIERTRDAAGALATGDLAEFGEILRGGHVSLRDMFEVSVPAVDAVVTELQAAIGAEGGARMTGGGFGGAVVAVLAADRVGELKRATGREFLRVH
ncbi:galactokinase [Qipengyuania sp. 6B39]|uniref:galactokinase n=1 Tax=Qipengyuania proteolytica TaxID=2867239 RepID=UPI001C891713|nr:galactokinase [Qipengyuania proteolytica]